MPKRSGRPFAFRWPSRKAPRQMVPTAIVEPVEAAIEAMARTRPTQVAPAIILATGAGVALWWWTQWARGAAESEILARDPEPPIQPD